MKRKKKAKGWKGEAQKSYKAYLERGKQPIVKPKYHKYYSHGQGSDRQIDSKD